MNMMHSLGLRFIIPSKIHNNDVDSTLSFVIQEDDTFETKDEQYLQRDTLETYKTAYVHLDVRERFAQK